MQSSNVMTNGDTFICGPLYWSYWSRVSRLGVNPLRFAMGTKYLSGFRWPRSVVRGVRIGLGDMGPLGLDHRAASRALRALEDAGLAVAERRAGRKPVVKLLDYWTPPLDMNLCTPIPWEWWYRASPLPGAAAVVALAILFQRDLVAEETIPFFLNGLGSRSCSRYAAGRGLRALEMAGLVAVRHRPGRPPIVTVR